MSLVSLLLVPLCLLLLPVCLLAVPVCLDLSDAVEPCCLDVPLLVVPGCLEVTEVPAVCLLLTLLPRFDAADVILLLD